MPFLLFCLALCAVPGASAEPPTPAPLRPALGSPVPATGEPGAEFPGRLSAHGRKVAAYLSSASEAKVLAELRARQRELVAELGRWQGLPAARREEFGKRLREIGELLALAERALRDPGLAARLRQAGQSAPQDPVAAMLAAASDHLGQVAANPAVAYDGNRARGETGAKTGSGAVKLDSKAGMGPSKAVEYSPPNASGSNAARGRITTRPPPPSESSTTEGPASLGTGVAARGKGVNGGSSLLPLVAESRRAASPASAPPGVKTAAASSAAAAAEAAPLSSEEQACLQAVGGDSAASSLCREHPVYASLLAGLGDAFREQFGTWSGALANLAFLFLGLLAPAVAATGGLLAAVVALIAAAGVIWALVTVLPALYSAVADLISSEKGSLQSYKAYRKLAEISVSVCVMILLTFLGVKAGKSLSSRFDLPGVFSGLTAKAGIKVSAPSFLRAPLERMSGGPKKAGLAASDGASLGGSENAVHNVKKGYFLEGKGSAAKKAAAHLDRELKTNAPPTPETAEALLKKVAEDAKAAVLRRSAGPAAQDSGISMSGGILSQTPAGKNLLVSLEVGDSEVFLGRKAGLKRLSVRSPAKTAPREEFVRIRQTEVAPGDVVFGAGRRIAEKLGAGAGEAHLLRAAPQKYFNTLSAKAGTPGGSGSAAGFRVAPTQRGSAAWAWLGGLLPKAPPRSAVDGGSGADKSQGEKTEQPPATSGGTEEKNNQPPPGTGDKKKEEKDHTPPTTTTPSTSNGSGNNSSSDSSGDAETSGARKEGGTEAGGPSDKHPKVPMPGGFGEKGGGGGGGGGGAPGSTGDAASRGRNMDGTSSAQDGGPSVPASAPVSAPDVPRQAATTLSSGSSRRPASMPSEPISGGHSSPARALSQRFDGVPENQRVAWSPAPMRGMGAGDSPMLSRMGGRAASPLRPPGPAQPDAMPEATAARAAQAPAPGPAAATKPSTEEDYNYTYLAPARHKYEFPNEKKPVSDDRRYLLSLALRASAVLAVAYLIYHSDIGYLLGMARRRRKKSEPDGEN